MTRRPLGYGGRVPPARGQAITLIAFFLAIMAALAALSLDVGYALVQQRKVQAACDASAMAATRLIAAGTGTTTDASVQSAITYYVRANGGQVSYGGDPPYYVNSSGLPISKVGAGSNVPSSAAGVAVTSTQVITAMFAGVFGISAFPVKAGCMMLAAPAQMPSSVDGLVPIGVPQQDYQSAGSSTYDLWGPQYGSTYGLPSSFKGLVDLGSGSGTGYVSDNCESTHARQEEDDDDHDDRDHEHDDNGGSGSQKDCMGRWARYGFGGTINTGNRIPTLNGNKTGWVHDGLVANCTAQNLSDGDGSYGIFKVLVFDDFSSSTGVRASRFAAFKAYCNAIGNSMRGTFVSYVVPGGQLSYGSSGGTAGPVTLKFAPMWQTFPTATPGSPTATPTTRNGTGTPTATRTPTRTPTARSCDDDHGEGCDDDHTRTPTATPTATATRTPTAGAATFSLGATTAENNRLTQYTTAMTCGAGTISTSAITWSSSQSTSLYFTIATSPPARATGTRSPGSGTATSGSLSLSSAVAAGTYYLYVDNQGNGSSRNAAVGAITVTCSAP